MQASLSHFTWVRRKFKATFYHRQPTALRLQQQGFPQKFKKADFKEKTTCQFSLTVCIIIKKIDQINLLGCFRTLPLGIEFFQILKNRIYLRVDENPIWVHHNILKRKNCQVESIETASHFPWGDKNFFNFHFDLFCYNSNLKE